MNFAQVAEGVYRSGQPDEDDLDHLSERYGIKSVVKLNSGKNPTNCPLVKSPRISGWSVIHYGPTTEQIKAILDAIDCAPKPVLVHCRHGQDRTGLIIALWRIRHGASIAEAYTDMMRRGFHANYSGVWNAWLRETGWDKPSADPALVAALASKPVCPSDVPSAELATSTQTPDPHVAGSASAL